MRAMARIAHSHSRRRKPVEESRVLPRKTARQDRSRATVESILEASARILIRSGYDALNTNLAAESAGVSVGTLYQYFPNKEALVAALLDRHLEEMLGIMRSEVPRLLAAPVVEAVPQFVRVMLESHRVDPELHRVFAEQLPRVGAFDRVAAVEKEAYDLVRTYLEVHRAEIAPENVDVAAFVVVTTVESLTHAAVLSRPDLLQSRELQGEITACVLRYLVPAAGAPR
jgi:AcrR family transcriptional regulator